MAVLCSSISNHCYRHPWVVLDLLTSIGLCPTQCLSDRITNASVLHRPQSDRLFFISLSIPFLVTLEQSTNWSMNTKKAKQLSSWQRCCSVTIVHGPPSFTPITFRCHESLWVKNDLKVQNCTSTTLILGYCPFSRKKRHRKEAIVLASRKDMINLAAGGIGFEWSCLFPALSLSLSFIVHPWLTDPTFSSAHWPPQSYYD